MSIIKKLFHKKHISVTLGIFGRMVHLLFLLLIYKLLVLIFKINKKYHYNQINLWSIDIGINLKPIDFNPHFD